MGYRNWLLILGASLAGMLIMADAAVARTWRVEKDGSGDYTTIQPAVNGAAPGDTIRLGIGRWTDYQSVVISGDWAENVYVHVTVDSLTIIGSGQDQSIIGPTAPIHLPSEMPKGIMVLSNTGRLMVEHLTIANIRDGWYHSWSSQLIARHCTFRGCGTGIVSWADRGNLVEDCEFYIGAAAIGIFGYTPGRDFQVRRCLFSSTANGGGVDFNTVDVVIEECTFRGGFVGTEFNFGATATIQDCEYENTIVNYSITAHTDSQVQLVRNQVRGGACRLYMDSGAMVSGYGNVFGGGTSATILTSSCVPSLHGNHILHGQGPTVRVENFTGEQQVIDMTGNFWGTSDADSIAAWIRDGVDDPAVHAIVDFDPFSATPLPAEQKSLGGVKNLYR